MDKKKRLEIIKAMALIASLCVDESVKEYWEVNGIAVPADGTPEDEWYDFYTYDENFSFVTRVFLRTMSLAAKTGGLECDGINVKAKRSYTPAQIEIIPDDNTFPEKEDAPLDTAQKVDLLEYIINKASSDKAFEREFLTGTLREREFIPIVDKLYDLAHNPTVKNAKERVFPDIKLSMFRLM